MDLRGKALEYSSRAKLETVISVPMETREDLALAYTPGIAEVSRAIVTDEAVLKTHTMVRNNLAVISDGSAVLGLGNIGHKASYPVMEGKAMLLKRFGNVNAVPIIVRTQEVDEFVEVVANIADSFGAINLEDIAAPRCFEIEAKLRERLAIPLMHDDRHGTGAVVLAALTGALRLVVHQGKDTRVVLSGAGAAGMGIAQILLAAGYTNLVMVDSRGVICKTRTDLEGLKREMVDKTNAECIEGGLAEALEGAGVFVGVSRAGLLTREMVGSMAKDPVVIAMANPEPEILPDAAREAGAAIVATGRSDYENQVNNALAFPSIFRAALDSGRQIDEAMLIRAAELIVEYHRPRLARNRLLPSILDERMHEWVAGELVRG